MMPATRLFWLCAGLAAAAMAISLFYVGPSHGDDTFIYMRYADHLLRHGVAQYNLGERSGGITSQVHFWLMTAVSGIFGTRIEVWKLATTIVYAAAIVLAFLAFKRTGAKAATAMICAALLGLEPHLLRWSGTGMENSLVACTLCALLLLHTAKPVGRAQNILFGLLLGLAGGVRPELFLFSGAYVGISLWTRRTGAKGMALGAVAGVLLVLGVTYILTGFALPQTSAAKAIFLAQPMRLSTLLPIPLIIASGSSVSLLVVARRIGKGGEFAHWAIAVLAYVSFVIVYLCVTHTLISTRYATSLSLPLLLSALYAVCLSGRAGEGRLSAAAKVFLALQLCAGLVTLWYFFPFTRASEETDIAKFSAAANRLTTGSDRIALTEIGIFGFYSDRYVIDLVGLTDPKTVAWGRVHGRPQDIAALEQLLKFRKATYYVCTFCEAEGDITGERTLFEPVYAQKVLRGNGSRGRGIERALWVLYRVKYRPGAARSAR